MQFECTSSIAAGDRVKLAGDILDFDEFFVADDQLQYDEAAFEKRLTHDPVAVQLLSEFRERLATHEPFTAASLEQLLHAFVGEKQVKIGQIIHALRVAVTGKSTGVGMFEALAILGRASAECRVKSEE